MMYINETINIAPPITAQEIQLCKNASIIFILPARNPAKDT